MRKKILITASTFPRWIGDSEPRFILDYAKSMKEYYDVTVLAPSAPGALSKENMDGVHVLRYRYFPIKSWETLCYPGAIVPRIKEKKTRAFLVPLLMLSLYIKLLRIHRHYDLIHAHWVIPQGIISSFIKTPYIVTGHGGDITSLNMGVIKFLKIRCLKRAKYITTVSNALMNHVEALYPNNKHAIISMGCNTNSFNKEYRVENYFEQGDRKVILFVGRLAEKKGVTYLLEAMKKIDALLVIVGSGPLEQELKKQAEIISEKVLFLGAKNHQELKTIYASSNIFVAPSITAKDGDQEGIPTAIMEAMASGLPVVSSRSGGIEELITDGFDGLLVSEKDVAAIAEKIHLLLKQPDLIAELSKHAAITAKKYDYSEIGEKYHDIISRYIKHEDKK